MFSRGNWQAGVPCHEFSASAGPSHTEPSKCQNLLSNASDSEASRKAGFGANSGFSKLDQLYRLYSRTERERENLNEQ